MPYIRLQIYAPDASGTHSQHATTPTTLEIVTAMRLLISPLIILPALFVTRIQATTITGTLQPTDLPTMADNSSTTGSRFPPGAQSPDQQAAFAETERIVVETFGPGFKLKDDDGNLLGPFAILAYTPETFLLYLKHMAAIMVLPSLSAKERELAVLATCSVTQAPYIIYAHKNIGVAVGLEQEQVDEAVEGRCPEGLGERERLVYEVGLEIARSRGQLGKEGFEMGVKGLGREGMASLAQVVASYLFSSVLVGVADVGVPGERV